MWVSRICPINTVLRQLAACQAVIHTVSASTGNGLTCYKGTRVGRSLYAQIHLPHDAHEGVGLLWEAIHAHISGDQAPCTCKEASLRPLLCTPEPIHGWLAQPGE